MITTSPLGEEEAVPSGRGAKGVAVPPWKRREAGGVGGHSDPIEHRLPSASARGRALRVNERQWRTEHSDEHGAEHGARSGRGLAMRSERVSEHGRHRDINLTWREQHHDVSGGREGAPDEWRSGPPTGTNMVGRLSICHLTN